MKSRVVFTDPETGAVIDSFEFESSVGDTFDARELVSRVLGLEADPSALARRIENDAGYRRSVLEMKYEPIFDGLHDGKFDAIADDRIQAAQWMCLAVDARIAAEEALR